MSSTVQCKTHSLLQYAVDVRHTHARGRDGSLIVVTVSILSRGVECSTSLCNTMQYGLFVESNSHSLRNPAALWLGKSQLLQLLWALTGNDVCWRPAVVTAQACSTLHFMV